MLQDTALSSLRASAPVTVASPFAELRFEADADGCTTSFEFGAQRHAFRSADEPAAQRRLRGMQLALYTVPADQWEEIKSRRRGSYALPRADGSVFVVSQESLGLPFCEAQSQRMPALETLSAPGRRPPLLAI